MFLWNDFFKEDARFQKPGLLLQALQSLSRERVVCFAAASTLHACAPFLSLERTGRYNPYHKDLLSLVSESAHVSWQAACTAVSPGALLDLASSIEELLSEQPSDVRKKCNEDDLLLAGLASMRSALGEEPIVNSALAAKRAYEAVALWFMATDPTTPKTLIGRAAILAAERAVSHCLEEVQYQERCLTFLCSPRNATLPQQADLLRL